MHFVSLVDILSHKVGTLVGIGRSVLSKRHGIKNASLSSHRTQVLLILYVM